MPPLCPRAPSLSKMSIYHALWVHLVKRGIRKERGIIF